MISEQHKKKIGKHIVDELGSKFGYANLDYQLDELPYVIVESQSRLIWLGANYIILNVMGVHNKMDKRISYSDPNMIDKIIEYVDQ